MDNEPVAPAIVAGQILWLRREIDTTPMHVLKLVYLCHGWMLGFNDQALIKEPVEAWTYGPVVPSTYHHYKKFGGGIILEKANDQSQNLNSEMSGLIEAIEGAYRHFAAFQLSEMTHQRSTPWDITLRKHGVGAVIPDALIREHYRDMIGS